MHTDDARGPKAARTPAAHSRLGILLVVLAWAIPAGVLVQAALAGQAWFFSPALFGLHGGVGHGVLSLALLAAVLAWVVPLSRTAGLLATLTLAALVGQTGLGYVGRRSEVALASSLHIPLGVAILGVSVATAVLLTVRRAETAP